MRYAVRLLTLSAALVVLLAGSVLAYSGGPVRNVTDLTPQCASCHSSVGREQVRNEPEAFATSQLVENKHYRALGDGLGEYQKMAPADRQRLLADVRTMDQNASVTISVPASLKPDQEVPVTVTVHGGQAVVGVFLVDTDLRFQARSIGADGWMVVGTPKVIGSDGREQTKWVDSRAPGLKKNLASVLVFDQKTDLAQKKFGEAKVTWTVRAPHQPGSYSMTAAFLFGTEKASPIGTVTTPTGVVLPRGGPAGPSARVMFAKPVAITVR